MKIWWQKLSTLFSKKIFMEQGQVENLFTQVDPKIPTIWILYLRQSSLSWAAEAYAWHSKLLFQK